MSYNTNIMFQQWLLENTVRRREGVKIALVKILC